MIEAAPSCTGSGRASRVVRKTFSDWHDGIEQSGEETSSLTREMLDFPLAMSTIGSGRRFMVTQTCCMGLVTYRPKPR